MNISDDNLIGKVRETFVLNQLQNAGLIAYFTNLGDFECAGYNFEIGGKNKNVDQVKSLKQGYVFADGILTGIGRKLPLYLLGFLS